MICKCGKSIQAEHGIIKCLRCGASYRLSLTAVVPGESSVRKNICQHRGPELYQINCGCSGADRVHRCNLLACECLPRKMKPWASITRTDGKERGTEPTYCNLCDHNTEYAK